MNTFKVTVGPMAVPWLRRLITGLWQQRPGFTRGSVNVGLVVVRVAMGQVFLQLFSFPCQYHSTLTVHAHILVSHRAEQYARCWPHFRDIVSPHRHEQNTHTHTHTHIYIYISRWNQENRIQNCAETVISSTLQTTRYKLILPLVLYGCKAWCVTLTLREEFRLQAFEYKVARTYVALRSESSSEYITWRLFLDFNIVK
jgi:hypothetical protein